MDKNINNNKVIVVDACPPSGNCWGCAYADLCDVWNDIGLTPYQIEVPKERG